MTNPDKQPHPDARKSNPSAVSVRIEPKRMGKAKFQRRHDFRIGGQPDYVDGDRSHLNRSILELRPLPVIQRENAELRKRAGRIRKMKSDAAVVTAGIITFGHNAQNVFNRLTPEVQDEAFTTLAQAIADCLETRLEALVVHLDETAIHAHFMLQAYNRHGEPLSNATKLGDLSALQDMAAEVMQRYAPEIERGQKKKVRLDAGADYPDVLHRSVEELHRDLPREIAARDAEVDKLESEREALESSIAKSLGYLEKLELKQELKTNEIKRRETYLARVKKKEDELAGIVSELEIKRRGYEGEDAKRQSEREAIETDKQEVRGQQAKVRADAQLVGQARNAYEAAMQAVEEVMEHAEADTLVIDPITKTLDVSSLPVLQKTSPKIKDRIVGMATQLARWQDRVYDMAVRLRDHTKRLTVFLSRHDIELEVKEEAKKIERGGEKFELGD